MADKVNERYTLIRTRQRSANAVGIAIEAIAELPVAERAGMVMALVQGVIDRTGFGDARDGLLTGLLRRTQREIDISAASVGGEGKEL